MRAVIVCRDNQDYSRDVEDFLRDFEMRTGKEIEKIDPDGIEGEAFCSAHDVVEYPTILALDDSGKVLDEWRGREFPRIDEVSYYARDKKM